MKILQLCKKFPYPLKDGESVAIYNMAKGLSAAGAEIHLFCVNTLKHFFDPAELPPAYNPYSSITSVTLDTRVTWTGALLNLFSKKSYHVERFRSEKVSTALRKLLEQGGFDLVQIEGVHLAGYAPIIRQYSSAEVALRTHNLEFQIWERIAARTKPGLKRWYIRYLTKKLKAYEVACLQETDFLVPISSQDFQQFVSLGYEGKHCLCPIGIDPGKYLPAPQKRDAFSVYFLGSLDWLPNLEGIQWFVAAVWPIFWQRHPEATLHLAGRNMPEWMFSLSGKGIRVHGEVPDAIEYMNQYAVMVVPLFSGSGMRAKIIEAMALGRTVVTTPLGLEGIPGQDGVSVCLASTAEEFVVQLERLLRDPQRAVQIGQAGRSLVLDHFRADAIAKSLLDAYRSWLEGRSTPQMPQVHG